MDKVVVITGASKGIGYQVAKIFADNLYIVCNLSRSKSPDNRIENYTVDISNPDNIDTALDDIILKYKRLDILINCAGFSMAAPIHKVKYDDIDYLMKVNLIGAIYTIKKVVPTMILNGGGRILNISSIGSVTPIPYDPYYSASKAGLDMLSVTLNTELNKHNIYVTSILPRGTRTNFTFNRKVYPNPINSSMAKATKVLSLIEQKGKSPRNIAGIIFKEAISIKPKVILPCGYENKLLYCTSKVLPKNSLIYITRKVFKTNL